MKKNIAVLGLGKSGVAVANLAVKLGYNVFASDIENLKINNLNKKVVTELGEHSDKILDSDFIIKSPGVCPNISILKKARENKISIISELDFSIKNSKYKKIIAVTGTNGKTTTTDLIYRIVKAYYKDSIISGNIGVPLSDKALKTTENTYIMMELSSYQLEDTPNFRSNISIMLNITPDHILEHHKTMKAYIKAKKNVFINQKHGDFTIINCDDKSCGKIISEIRAKQFAHIKFNSKLIFFSKKPLKNGVFYDNGKIVIRIFNKQNEIHPKINIVGLHNIENILAATAASYVAGITPTVIEKIISEYKGAEHRIEFVKTVNGVVYYNDSKSTNIDSIKVALESFNGNILLIMGGRDKGFPYVPLKKLIRQKVKSIFLIGEATERIIKDLNETVPLFNCGNMENAIKRIFKMAVTGDIVLLSPGCASFDQFHDFEERGTFFKRLVNKL